MFGVIKNKHRIFEFSRCNIFNLWICVRYYISLWGAESCDIIPIQKFTKENRETRDKVVLLTLEIIKTQLLPPNNNWTMKCMVCPKCVRNGHAWKQPPWVTLNLFLMDTREFLFNLNFSALCSPCFPLRTSVSLCQTFTHVAKLRKRRRHSNSPEECGKSTLCSPISTKSRQSTNQHPRWLVFIASDKYYFCSKTTKILLYSLCLLKGKEKELFTAIPLSYFHRV